MSRIDIGDRNRRIDLIRGISILLVLFHHFNIAYPLDDTVLARAFGWEAVRAVARNGNYGVTMFFVVSGFLITANALRRWGDLRQVAVRAFYGLRAARILPCLVLLLLAVDALALAGFRVFQNHPPDRGGAPVSYGLAHLAALTSWMNVLVGQVGWFNYPLGVLWSLSVEEAFYFAFPLACLALRSETRLAGFWAKFIIIGPAWRITHQGDEGGWLYGYLACFDGIAIGCCTALLARRILMRGRIAAVFQATVAVGMGFLYLRAPIAQTNVYGVSLMALGTAILLLGAHGNPSGPLLERSRILAAVGWAGRLSYELYLFHLIVLGALRIAYPPRTVAGDTKLVLLVAFLLFSTGLATVISGLYSEPLNRRMRRILAPSVYSPLPRSGGLSREADQGQA
jgi:peptidoglycan/LPS O-acetylase OafA/YrhL